MELPIERLTRGTGQYFFGYYDVPAFSANQKYHLCHEVQFWDRLPTRTDRAKLGLIDLASKQFEVITETNTWNFQQGAMLQWSPLAPDDEIIFNDEQDGDYQGVMLNIHSGRRRSLERPVAAVDPTGKYALSINFDRMYDFRPGYGYAGKPDPFRAVDHPAEDGVFLIDLASGRSRLIISLEQLWELSKDHPKLQHKKIMINHITFNPDGSRFVFLVRYFPEPGRHWETAIFTAAWDGAAIHKLSDYGYASHYHWRDPGHILFHCAGQAGEQLYLLTDRTRESVVIDAGFFRKDGHCSYSPDLAWLLYDSYPDEAGLRYLYLYHLSGGKGITLGSYNAIPPFKDFLIDLRCDLHPRWNRAGTAISFDSIHEGQRHVYRMDLQELISTWE